MRTWLKLLLIPIILVIAFIVWRQTRSTSVSVVHYRTARAARGDVIQTVSGSGTIDAVTTVAVGSQVSGNIVKIYADFNDTVKAGQLITEIEPSNYEAKLIQAEADLTSARATLELKQVNYDRISSLLKRGLVTQSDFDDAKAALRQQEATVKAKEASLKSAQVDLSHTKIYSPVDGIVLSRAVDVGQTVQASFSAPTLFTIAQDLRQMQISASISEADIGNVEASQDVTFTVDAFSSRTFKGKVRQVRNNSTTSNNVVTYPTIITVDNSDLKLRPGMTANITIATMRRTGVIRVPNSALRFRPPENAAVIAAAKPQAPSFDQMPEEVRKHLLAEFDKNGDGKLDADERKVMEATMKNRMASASAGGSFGPPPDGGFGGPPPGGGGPGGGGPGGGPGGGGSGGRSSGGSARASSSSTTNSSQPVTVYITRGTPNAAGHVTGEIEAVNVFPGVSDSSYTEILSGLDENATVITGTVSAQQAAAATATGTNNLFGPQRPPGAGRSR